MKCHHRSSSRDFSHLEGPSELVSTYTFGNVVGIFAKTLLAYEEDTFQRQN